MAAHIITIANRKGGVGKTTTAVNLAAGLAIKLRHSVPPGAPSNRVLFVDLDPSMNGVMCLDYDRRHSPYELSLPALLVDDTPPPVQKVLRSAKWHENLHFIPSHHKGMEKASLQLVGLPVADMRLKYALEPIVAYYSYIIIDTPPSAGLLFNNAIMAASYLLIPIETSYRGASGLGDLHTDLVDMLKAFRRTDFQILGYLPTMYEANAGDAKEILDSMRERYGEKTLSPVHRSRLIQQANGANMDVFTYAPPRSRDGGQLKSSKRPTVEYGHLVEEIVLRMSSPAVEVMNGA